MKFMLIYSILTYSELTELKWAELFEEKKLLDFSGNLIQLIRIDENKELIWLLKWA